MSASPVAIVTASSRGIGAACARETAARGYKVVLMARSEGILKLASELNAIGVRASITEPSDLANGVTVAQHHGRIDAVVKNFGDPAGGDSPRSPTHSGRRSSKPT